MKPRGLRDLDTPGNLNKCLPMSTRVFMVSKGSKFRRPGFIIQGIYTIANQMVSLKQDTCDVNRPNEPKRQ